MRCIRKWSYHIWFKELYEPCPLETYQIPSYRVKPKTPTTTMDEIECVKCHIREKTHKKMYKGEYFGSEIAEELYELGYNYHNPKLSKRVRFHKINLDEITDFYGEPEKDNTHIMKYATIEDKSYFGRPHHFFYKDNMRWVDK